MTPRIGCVVLTMGRRPDDLQLALDSLLAQQGVELDIVVVGNAWEPTGLPEGVRGIGLPRNVGIPAGRNAGIDAIGGDLVFFLDEDASLVAPDTLARVAAKFAADPALGCCSCAAVPREGDRRSTDWVGRVGRGAEARSGDVTVIWEGAVAMPRRVLDEVGRWPGEFLFVHEGVDLAWRVMDAGYRVHYAADLVARHPSPPLGPARHGYSTYYGARNRVWLARRYLPAPLGAVYVASFAARTLPRLRDPELRRHAARGVP